MRDNDVGFAVTIDVADSDGMGSLAVCCIVHRWFENADRLESYRRVAGIAEAIQMKPIAVGM